MKNHKAVRRSTELWCTAQSPGSWCGVARLSLWRWHLVTACRFSAMLAEHLIYIFLFSPLPVYCSPRSVLQEGRNASKHTEGQQAKSSSGAH